MVKLLNIDCMEYMATCKDKQSDLAVVDPPYGINAAKRNGSIGQKKGQGKITRYVLKEWDSEIPNQEYFNELFRISKNQIIWGANYMVKYLPAGMGWIVYDKLQPEGVTFAMAELAYTSFERSVKIYRTSRANMQNCVSNNNIIGKQNAKIHPTQKPIQLYKWLLKNYANPGDTILDTHLGSGSSAIAAYDGGFDFVGCEIDKDYFDAGCKRFENYKLQLKLF